MSARQSLLDQPYWFGITLVNANGTLARPLFEPFMPVVQARLTGEPTDNPSLPPRVFHGGGRITRLEATNTHTSAVTLFLFRGTRMNVNTGTSSSGLAIPTTTTVTRSSGSFLLDDRSGRALNIDPALSDSHGWQVGDILIIRDTAVAANNGLRTQVSAVAAGTLTVATALTVDATPLATAELWRLTQMTSISVALSAGNTTSAPPTVILGSTQDPGTNARPDQFIGIGSNQALFVAPSTAITAPTLLHVTGEIFLQ